MSIELPPFHQKNFLVMAGGTGGHIFPALEVADALSEQGARVFWLGTEQGLELKLISGKYPLFCLRTRSIRNKPLSKVALSLFSLIRSIWHATIACQGGY